MKISPPQSQRLLDRPRLLEMLDKEKEKRVILVLGQAAQGKSTLIASWVSRFTLPTVWVNLEKEDSDSINLYYLLIQGLQRILDTPELASLLQYPAIIMGPRGEISLHRDWTAKIYGSIPCPVRIVFDGLDRLSPEKTALRFLKILIEEAPEHIHLVVISRSNPFLGVERLRMDRNTALIENNTLAFSVEETRRFFSEICGIPLHFELAQKVHGLTEGWIGGLILLWETLRKLPQKEALRHLSDGLGFRFRLDLFRFFSETIFSSEPKQIQDFLVHSSILDSIEPRLARALTGIENCEEICLKLAARNFFVQTIYDEKKGWVFRYHHLFKDFLISKFQTETNKEERQSWFATAGSLFEQSESPERAIQFYLDAEEYPKAIRVIEKVGISVLKEGRIGDLSQWLQAIPDAFFKESPWLSFFRCVTTRFSNMKENCHILQRLVSQFNSAKDIRGQLLAYAFLIESFFMRGSFTIPLNSLIQRGTEILNFAESEEYLFERTSLLLQIGLCFLATDPKKGFKVFQDAYDASVQLKSQPLQILALSHAVACLAFAGEFAPVEEYLEKIAPLTKKCTHPEVNAFHHMDRSILFLHTGDLPAAAKAIEKAQTVIKEHRLDYLYPMTLWYAFLLNMYRREYDAAWQIGLEFHAVSSLDETSTHFAGALWFLGFCLYHQEDYAQSAEYIRNSLNTLLSHQGRHEVILNDVRVVFGFLKSHLPDLEGVGQHLETALQFFQDTANSLRLAEAHIAMALCFWKNGNVEKTSEHLSEAFTITRKRDYSHFLLISPQDLIRACVLALQLRIEEVSAYALQLLKTKFPRVATLGEMDQLTQGATPDMKGIEFEMERAIRRQKTMPLRIEVLGTFRILRGEDVFDEKEWKGTKPKNLLKALIARGAGKAPREVLMEDLWPESSTRAAENNFKVTLHRLRTVLEPEMERAYGSSYLHLRDNFLFLDRGLCTVDVEEFQSFAEHGQKEEEKGNFKEALTLYDKAAALYKGDFLEADLYFPWAERKRQMFRRRYTGILSKMASLWEREGKAKKAIDCYQQIIQVEPFKEEAYRKTMLLYAKLGLPNEALDIYGNCQRMLKAELDIEPDEVTISIYKKIAEDIKKAKTMAK